MARLRNLLVATILALFQQPGLAYPRAHYAAKVFEGGRGVEEEYDYIIVGGGTAGLTVADRLTEDGESTVLVVEIGQLSTSPVSVQQFHSHHHPFVCHMRCCR